MSKYVSDYFAKYGSFSAPAADTAAAAADTTADGDGDGEGIEGIEGEGAMEEH